MKTRFYTSISVAAFMAVLIYKAYIALVESLQIWRELGYVQFMKVKDELILSYGVVEVLFLVIMTYFILQAVDSYRAWRDRRK